LTKIKTEGHLHFGFRADGDRYPAGLGRILPLYTTILNHACKNLRSVTLHMGYDKECLNMGRQSASLQYVRFPLTGSDDARAGRSKTDEEKLDQIVGRVIKSLPALQYLQPGD
jgi:hypothetical protein